MDVEFIEERGGEAQFKENAKTRMTVTDSDSPNVFGYIKIEDEIICGISYCDYGIPPQIVIDRADRIWIGFGEKLAVIDERTRDIIWERKLFSVFFAIISDTNQKYMCIICELDIYCYNQDRLIWEHGFPDIICGFKIAEDRIAVIKYGDNEVCYCLHNGQPVKASV